MKRVRVKIPDELAEALNEMPFGIKSLFYQEIFGLVVGETKEETMANIKRIITGNYEFAFLKGGGSGRREEKAKTKMEELEELTEDF